MNERAARLLREITVVTRMTRQSIEREYALLIEWGFTSRKAEAELRDKYLTGARAVSYRK